MKKLTLVTVTFNSRHTLYDTINSVLQQTYPYIEYIIIDGASTDNTVGVIKQYEHDLMNVYDGFQKKMMDFMML